MRDALREQLQSTLTGTYELGGELGGGGMSRVFIARDVALGRQVVVKVLSPELGAGASCRAARHMRTKGSIHGPKNFLERSTPTRFSPAPSGVWAIGFA
jgi:eukaryotic-like serine/threonine-protein kinase